MTEERKQMWNAMGIEVVGQHAVEDWTTQCVLREEAKRKE